MDLNIGDSKPSNPIVTDNSNPPKQLGLSDGFFTLSWVIDNPGVLTVDPSSLKMIALSPGGATITWKATPAGGSKYSAGPSVSYVDGPHNVLPPPEFVSLVVNH